MIQFDDNVDDLTALISVLPKRIQEEISKIDGQDPIVEIVMDLGRFAEIRFNKSIIRLKNMAPIGLDDISTITKNIGSFDTENRAGIERTLHRISAIKNRRNEVIGLTCRVGRAVEGTLELLRDIVESNKNILFLGPPGIGKTTKLRETARLLADELERRIVIVDTSNEIAGDGDIPHPGIGSARRMQVISPDRQHQVMIEAVENHTPQVIIVDEIGTEAEAQAARTIAERGVQLIATAHGRTLENIIKNPTLADLIGGIQSVILGDEEAKFRGTQKTVLERKTMPTFDVIIEIRERDMYAIYEDTAEAVDLILRGEFIQPEIRSKDSYSSIIETPDNITAPLNFNEALETPLPVMPSLASGDTLNIFCFGISVQRMKMAVTSLNLPVEIVQNIEDADLLLTVKSHMTTKAKVRQLVKDHRIPIHVIKRNTQPDMTAFLRHQFKLPATETDVENAALIEAERIATQVLEEFKTKECAPQEESVRRKQHQLCREMGLNSISVGEDPERRIRIYPKEKR